MFRRSSMSLAVAFALSGMTGPAVSMAAENQDDSTRLDTLEVTATRSATKTETPFVETPQSISIITEEQIEDQGSRNVQEATRYTAGVFTQQYGATASRYDAIKLRGFGSDSIDNQYLDGLKLLNDKGTYSIMQVDPYFLERIEVVKGPSSVLYGRAAPGGLVALTSKKPTFTPSYEIQAGVGTQGYKSLGFDFSSEVGDSGNAAYRLVGLVKQSDSQWDHVEEERYAIAPSVTIDISDATTLILMAYLQKDPEGGFYGGLPADGTLYPHNGQKISNTFNDGEPAYEEFEREQKMVGYQLDHRFNDIWSARQNLRYIDTDVVYGQVYNLGTWTGNELNRAYFGADEQLSAWAADNQLIADFDVADTKHTVLTGLDYQYLETDVYWNLGSFPSINPFNPQYGATGTITPYQDNNRKLEQLGLYVQDQVEINQWRLTLGGRQDWIDVENVNRTIASATVATQKKDDTHFSGRAALMYLFDNGISPYVSYSESFSPSSNIDENGDLIEATEGEQYEAGMKFQPVGSRDRYSIAVFHIDQDNVANYIWETQAYRPVGSTRSEGVELEAHTYLTDNLSILASYTYTDVTVEESTTGTEGKTPVGTPRHMAGLWGSYEFMEGVLAGLDTGLGVRYIGDSWADEGNTLEIPDYTLVDAMLGYDLSNVGLQGVTAQVNANNLFDNEYVGSCYNAAVCYYGAERSVQATVTYNF